MSTRKAGASIRRRGTGVGKAEDARTTPEGAMETRTRPEAAAGTHSASAAGVAPRGPFKLFAGGARSPAPPLGRPRVATP